MRGAGKLPLLIRLSESIPCGCALLAFYAPFALSLLPVLSWIRLTPMRAAALLSHASTPLAPRRAASSALIRHHPSARPVPRIAVSRPRFSSMLATPKDDSYTGGRALEVRDGQLSTSGI